MEYLTAKQVAEKYGIKIKTVRVHIDRNKFYAFSSDGQVKTGSARTDIWLIREDAAEWLYGKK